MQARRRRVEADIGRDHTGAGRSIELIGMGNLMNVATITHGAQEGGLEGDFRGHGRGLKRARQGL